MKIIEAMKRVKANKEKIGDLQKKIQAHSAHLSHETPLYEDTKAKIVEWAQSCEDCAQENVRLLVAIQRTNLATSVDIRLGEKIVTKTISEWVWRRREYHQLDFATWASMGDRGLKESQTVGTSVGVPMEIKIVRNYDVELRDKRMAMYKGEAHEIDAALEVVNAVTDLIET
jgi:hypothetical protein